MLLLSEDRSKFKCYTHTHTHTRACVHSRAQSCIPAENAVWTCYRWVIGQLWVWWKHRSDTLAYSSSMHINAQIWWTLTPVTSNESTSWHSLWDFWVQSSLLKILGLVDATLPSFGVRKNERQTRKGRVAFNLWPCYFPKIHQHRVAYSFFFFSLSLAARIRHLCAFRAFT